MKERDLCLVTSDDQAIRHFVDTGKPKTTRVAARMAGPRLMKNYYKFHQNRMTQRFWAGDDANLRGYIGMVEQALRHAQLKFSKDKNVRKSVCNTGLAIALSIAEENRILVDEGLVRKCITLIVQSNAAGEPSLLIDLLRSCLTAYPWQKSAIFLNAPESLSIERQVARGQMIQRAHRPQAAHQAAAEQVWDLCNEAGWKMLRVQNATNRPDLPVANT